MKTTKKQDTQDLTFIDLFAGIGGFRFALEAEGARCVFTSEWDKFAQETYKANFDCEIAGDITKVKEQDVPEHDILCGGFPCQAFSISGKQLGFEDTRGTLIFDVLRIIRYRMPKVVFLENVKNLEKHDNGNTFKAIKDNIEALGYDVYHKVLNASEYGVPQARHRIYIVAFRKDLNIAGFKFPTKSKTIVSLKSILLKKNSEDLKDLVISRKFKKIKKSEKAGNKPIQIGYFGKGRQGERIYSIEGHAITLSAYGGGIASKTGAYNVNGEIRKLHPKECARVQGFPKDFKIPPSISNSQAWKQFGNSVAVPVVNKIFKKIIQKL
jgi:DNA (cytosine-5)-methyltransferase 1